MKCPICKHEFTYSILESLEDLPVTKVLLHKMLDESLDMEKSWAVEFVKKAYFVVAVEAINEEEAEMKANLALDKYSEEQFASNFSAWEDEWEVDVHRWKEYGFKAGIESFVK